MRQTRTVTTHTCDVCGDPIDSSNADPGDALVGVQGRLLIIRKVEKGLADTCSGCHASMQATIRERAARAGRVAA